MEASQHPAGWSSFVPAEPRQEHGCPCGTGAPGTARGALWAWVASGALYTQLCGHLPQVLVAPSPKCSRKCCCSPFQCLVSVVLPHVKGPIMGVGVSPAQLPADLCFLPAQTTPMLLFPASKNALLEEEMQFMAIGHSKGPLDHLTPALPSSPLQGKLFLAGVQVRDHPEQSAHSTSPALGQGQPHWSTDPC